MAVDLHIHTTASDGTLSPEEVVQLSSKLALKAVAIADHDSVDGVDAAMRAGRLASIEVVPAVELSAELDGLDVHFLGYFIRHKHAWLAAHLRKLRDARLKRALEMLEKLREVGLEIPLKDVLALAGKGAVGRAHVARAMLLHGYIDDIRQAFERYIGRDACCYVSKYPYSPEDVIQIIKKMAGLTVIAHPGVSRVDGYLDRFQEAGLDGIECYHSDHNPQQVARYLRIARERGLAPAGGSDCHGLRSGRPLTIGSLSVPDSVLEGLKRRLATVRSQAAPSH